MQCRTRGENLVGVLLEKEEVPGVSEQVMNVCIDSFMKRPSTKRFALNVISNFVNNIVYMKKKPGNPLPYTAALLFLSGGKANCNVSGKGNVLYFSEDETKIFNNANIQDLGVKTSYVLEVNNEFKLQKGTNSFLLCTDELLEQIEPDEIKRLLQESESPNEWMDKIIGSCENKDVSAMALILGKTKRGEKLLKFIPFIIAILIALGLLIWRLL